MTEGGPIRISELSLNKWGSVICVTDEMMADYNGDLTDWMAHWQRAQARKRRKRELFKRRGDRVE